MHVNKLFKIDSSITKSLTLDNNGIENIDDREYSSVQCIFNPGSNVPSDKDTLCRFDNICYSINHSNKESYVTQIHPKGKFFYFENANSPPEYIINDWGNILFDFKNIKFVFKSQWKFDMHIYNGSIQSLVHNSSDIIWFEENVALHEPFWPENFGHCLGDDFLATYKILSKFGLYSPENCKILFFHYFNLRYWGTTETDIKRTERSLKFYKYINEYLYDNQYIFLTKYEDDIIQNNNNIKYLCFKTAIISSTAFSKQNHNPFEWSSFLDIFLNKYETHRYNMRQLHNSQKQRILFLSKSQGMHGRAWANNNTKTEIVDYLSNLFQVDIDMINDNELNELTLYDQINLVLKYTILITPPGAVSYLGLFMAPNTCVIVKDVFDWYNKRSVRLDPNIWNYDHRKKVYYISTKQSDAKFKLSWDKMMRKPAKDIFYAFRDGADLYLNPKKVAYLVYNALNWVEKKMQWKNTYYLPTNWKDYMIANE